MRQNRTFGKKILLNRIFLTISLLVFVSLIVFANTVIAEFPPVYGVEIFEYDYSLTRAPGTSETYEVKVKNTGVMELGEIKLGVERLDSDWFSSDETVSLKFGEVGVLRYDLKVPEDAEGLYAFSLVVYGTSGVTTISSAKIVSLTVGTTTTVPPTTLPPTTTSRPLITLPKINETQIQNLTSEILEDLKNISEEVFSKFQCALSYVKTTAKAILTDEILLLDVAGALLIILFVLLIVRKVIAG